MASLSVSVTVELDVYHTWEYYFNQINGWWPKEYFTSAKTKRFIIETYLGGRVYEDHGEGEGITWGDIIGVEYPRSLQIRGNLTKESGGPAITFEKFTFDSIAPGTSITYTADFIGDIDERGLKSLKEGWEALLQHHFKNYCAERN